MGRSLLCVRKTIVILLCVAVLIGVYFLTMIRPFDDFWAETKAILSGDLKPDANHPLWIDYRLNDGKPYSLAADVELDIKRYFVWCFGDRGGMTVMFSQKYYDKAGNFVTKDQVGPEIWTLEKINGSWMLTDRHLPNL